MEVTEQGVFFSTSSSWVAACKLWASFWVTTYCWRFVSRIGSILPPFFFKGVWGVGWGDPGGLAAVERAGERSSTAG